MKLSSTQCFRFLLLALLLFTAPGLLAQERGYIERDCGFDLDKDGLVGETVGIDCSTLCNGGGVTGADEIYVSCAYDPLFPAGADTVDDPNTSENEGCGSSSSPCLTLGFAFGTIADGPSAGDGRDIVCFRNTCREENLSPQYSGASGTHTRPAIAGVPNSEGNPWQYPSNPGMLVGWDVDGDGVYPPHDDPVPNPVPGEVYHTAILEPPAPPCPEALNQECTAATIDNKDSGPRFYQKGSERTFFLNNELSYLEFAHFTVRDYGRYTLTYNSGFLDLNYHPGGHQAQNDSTHFYFHDIELHDLNRDSNYNSRTSAINTFNWRARHVNFDNMLFTNNGHWFARGGLDSTISRGPFGWKNLTVTLDACKPPPAYTCDWQTDNANCSDSNPSGFCCASGDICLDPDHCEPTGAEVCDTRASTTFKIWGYYHGLEILDSIFDANTLNQYQPTSAGKARGIDIAQCTQGWTVRNNELIDYNSSIELNPWSNDSCDGEKNGTDITVLEARPVTDVVIDRNLIRHPAPTGVLDHGIALKEGGTEYPNQVIGDVTLSNNMITSDDGFEHCMVIDASHGWDESDTNYPIEEVPGAVRLLNNTCYGPITVRAAILIGDLQGNNQNTKQNDFVVRNNIVGGITSGVANLAISYAPTNFDAGTNVWDPDGGYRWDQAANVQIDFATWQIESGDTGSSECVPTLLLTDGTYSNGDARPQDGDLHLHPADTCALDQGSDLSVQISDDIDADARPYGNAFDIGADEVTPRPLDQPALVHSGTPTGLLPYGTTTGDLTVETDQDTQCDVATTPGVPYGDTNRTDLNTVSGTAFDTHHTLPLSGLVRDTTYSYYVRCENTNGKINPDDYEITFTVAGLATNLVAHWTFDETSGCTAADSSNSHDGTLEPNCAGSAAPEWTTGILDGALDFDGGNDYVEVVDDPALAFTGSFTATAWIRPESFGDGNYGRIVAKQQYVGGFGPGWSVYLVTNGTNPAGERSICVNIDTGFSDCADDLSIDLDTWQHVAVVFDDEGDQVRFFVNGEAEGVLTTSQELRASTVPLRIGDRDDLARSFDGKIDDLRLYSRALTEAEIDDLSISPNAPPLRSAGAPSGNLPAATGSVLLELDTNKAATCRWASQAGIGYGSMNPNNTFTADVAGKHHEFTLSVLDDRLYRIHVRCQDGSGNTNTDDYRLEFYVGFHPSDLSAVDFFVETRHGLTVATGTDPVDVVNYCDLNIFPDGCVRRWEDQSGYTGGSVVGREFGQDDAEKPGLILDCLAGQPCVRGGFASESPNWSQDLGLEIELPDAISNLNGALSVYLLARPVTQSSAYSYMGSEDTHLEHDITNDSLKLRIGGGTATTVTTSGAITNGVFQLVEIHRDASDAITILVNGADITFGTPVLAGGFDFRFLFSKSRNDYMVGDLAAALVADRALTTTEQEQVRNYFHAVYGVLPFGETPVVRFALDEGSGCSTSDDSTIHTGTLGPTCGSGNGPVWLSAGGVTVLDYDGVNDYVSVPHSTALDMSGSFTLSAWIEPLSFGQNNYGRIASKQQYVGGFGSGYDVYLGNQPSGVPASTETLCANIGNGDSGCGDDHAITLGTWQHAVVVYDASTGGVTFYIDGFQAGGFTATGSLGSSAVPLTLGNRQSLNRTFKGGLDDVRLFDQALDADEVYDLFMSMKP